MRNLLVGRRIWVVIVKEDTMDTVDHQYTCVSRGFKQFLPAGPVDYGEPARPTNGIRERHLVQLWTDTGLRTLAVADVHLKRPSGFKKANGDE